MKVKMLSRNPDNYVRETKLDLQRGRGVFRECWGLASLSVEEKLYVWGAVLRETQRSSPGQGSFLPHFPFPKASVDS